MKETDRRMRKEIILPKDLETLAPDMKTIHLLDILFTRYGRIAYVSLYKQAISRMTQDQVADLYRHEVDQERDIALSLGGIGPEIFKRDLFNPTVTAKEILREEGVYDSIQETMKEVQEHQTASSYVAKLVTIFEELITRNDYRQLRDITNKYREYISLILDRPEYRAESMKRAQEFLEEFRLRRSDFPSFPFSLS